MAVETLCFSVILIVNYIGTYGRAKPKAKDGLCTITFVMPFSRETSFWLAIVYYYN